MSHTIVVTGASGFIGGAVMRIGREQGFNMVALSREGGLEPIRRAIMDANPTSVIHCAWPSRRADRLNPEVQKDAERFTEGFVDVCLRRALDRGRPLRFVGLGSQAEIADTNPAMLTPYGMSKYRAGLYVRLSGRSVGTLFPAVWARLFSVYGPGDHPESLVMRGLANGMGVGVGSDGQHLWDFLHVDDAARALLHLAAPTAPQGIVDVAAGHVRTLRQYLVDAGIRASFGTRRDPDLHPDLGPLMRSGWVPTITWSEGIADLRARLAPPRPCSTCGRGTWQDAVYLRCLGCDHQVKNCNCLKPLLATDVALETKP